MAILTHSEILKKIKSGAIKIKPFTAQSIGPASIDFHLDNQFRVFRASREIYHVNHQADYQDITKTLVIDDHFVLMPGQTAHGITVETLTLPDNLCGWIEGRSSLGRLGLMVHITAGFIQPGTSNKQVLEFNNAGPIPLAIHPGIAICQVILEETRGSARYSGRFQGQINP